MYDDIDDKVSYWYDLFALIMADYIPHNTVTVHVKEKPWVNCELKKLIRRRNVLWKRYKLPNNPHTIIVLRRSEIG